MGNPGKPSSAPSIQHFSHEHQLQLLNIKTHPNLNTVSCAGCKNNPQPSVWVYACNPCNFILHIPCSQMPKLIRHPLDQTHPFTLLARTAYPGGEFSCDACGDIGNGFCYNCSSCGLDLHILCASESKPSHPPPQVGLPFSPFHSYVQNNIIEDNNNGAVRVVLQNQEQLGEEFVRNYMIGNAMVQQQARDSFVQGLNMGNSMVAENQLRINHLQNFLGMGGNNGSAGGSNYVQNFMRGNGNGGPYQWSS